MESNSYSTLFESQQLFFHSGKTRGITFRKEALKKLRSAILMHEEELYEALYQDLHKSKFESFTTEIGFVLEELSFILKKLNKWARPKRVPSGIINFPAKSFVKQEPLGTVLVVAPWNYPFQLLIAPLIGAIAAGNTVILKPSEISEHTANAISKMINSTFEKEYIHVVTGGVDVSQKLVDLKVNHLFFTGSTHIGRMVMQAAAKNLVPITLELGGKSPCIVDENTDVKQAAKRIVWGKLLNAGQTCIAPDYLLVHEKVKDRLLKEMVKFIEKFYGKDPKNSEEYPRIISEANVERLATLLDGADIFYGGKYDRKNKYFAPTILDNVHFDLPVMKQEIFGPVLPVLSYREINQAIDQVNSQPRPLALYVFSKSRTFCDQVVESIPAGGVTVNDTIMHIASSRLPFGGVGYSGIGKYHGAYSFFTFSNAKPVMYRGRWLDVPLRYAPFKNKIKIAKYIFR